MLILLESIIAGGADLLGGLGGGHAVNATRNQIHGFLRSINAVDLHILAGDGHGRVSAQPALVVDAEDGVKVIGLQQVADHGLAAFHVGIGVHGHKNVDSLVLYGIQEAGLTVDARAVRRVVQDCDIRAVRKILQHGLGAQHARLIVVRRDEGGDQVGVGYAGVKVDDRDTRLGQLLKRGLNGVLVNGVKEHSGYALRDEVLDDLDLLGGVLLGVDDNGLVTLSFGGGSNTICHEELGGAPIGDAKGLAGLFSNGEPAHAGGHQQNGYQDCHDLFHVFVSFSFMY